MITENTLRKYKKAGLAAAVLAVVSALLFHYWLGPWGYYRQVSDAEKLLRDQVLSAAEGWLGANEADGTHRPIIDRYNTHEPLAMDYSVTYEDSWCAAFVSAVFIQCGLTDILPTECSCERQIGLFQEIGRWEEEDSIIPLPGDIIYYDWNNRKLGDCTGWSDYVGIVVGTKWPFIKVIEGNKDDRVAYRYLPINDIHIRGYGKPNYAAMAKNIP